MTAISIFFVMAGFSIFLKLIYINKHIYYAEHLVFTLHFFSMVLIFFTIGALLGEINSDINTIFLFFIPCIYLFLAIKKVYHIKWIGAIVSTAVLSFAYWIMLFLWSYSVIMIGALRV
jgi:hypothetical protein